jgi:hypothetical protein
MVREQARVTSHLDVFWIFGILVLAAIPFVSLMKRSVARAGLSPH